MYKEDLVLYNLQWLTCHKNHPNQAKLIFIFTKYWLLHSQAFFRYVLLESETFKEFLNESKKVPIHYLSLEIYHIC